MKLAVMNKGSLVYCNVKNTTLLQMEFYYLSFFVACNLVEVMLDGDSIT